MWIKAEDRLPEEGKYVLARHSRGTWIDRGDPENVNCVVVRLQRGITLAEREKLRNGAPLPGAKGWGGDAPRWATHYSADEGSNNRKPYCWKEFGPDCFFGQDIIAWQPIEPFAG
jgi:hypothetical protein